MRFIYLFVYLLFSFPLCSFGQTEMKKQGFVFSKESHIRLKDIQVLNIRSKQHQVTDVQGRFIISVLPLDTLEFRHPKWHTQQILGKDLTDTVFMLSSTMALEEILVLGKSSQADLLAYEELNQAKNAKTGIYYQGKPPLALLSPFGGQPITFFYELLSKNGREARKRAKYMLQLEEDVKIEKVFNAAIIQSIVDLQDHEITPFIVQFKPSYAQIESWSTYDMQVYIKKCYSEFKQVSK